MQTLRVSSNTMRIGREAGYYNALDCFRARAGILPEMYYDEDAEDRAAEARRYARCARLCAKALANMEARLDSLKAGRHGTEAANIY